MLHNAAYAAAATAVIPTAMWDAPPVPLTTLPVDPGNQSSLAGHNPILRVFPATLREVVPSGTQYKLS